MLKKVIFYIEYLPVHELAARVFMDLWMQGIEAERLPASELLRRIKEPIENNESYADEENGGQELLVVTDLPAIAAYFRAKGIAVLGYLHEKNRGASFPDVLYLTEDFSGIDAEYCRLVYDRAHGIPRKILETPRCIVREIAETDLDRLYEIYEDPGITAYMEPLFEDRQEELVYTRNYITQVYAFYGFGMWIIEEKESGLIIGRAGIEQKEECPELGYLLAADKQGQGLAEEVCREILRYAEEELGIREIRARVQPDNVRSANLCRRLGLVSEGIVGEYEIFVWHAKAGIVNNSIL